MRPLSLLAAACLAVSPLVAQGPPPVDRSALAIFDRLVGEWRGSSWVIQGPGGRHTVEQWESVRPVAGGTVIAVQGIGTEKMPDGTTRTVHDAFATVYIDRDGHSPRMRAFVASGQYMDADLVTTPDGYTWGMTVPGDIRIRYEMTFDAEGRWVEKGAMSRDQGATWTPFMEMTLVRQK